MVMWRNWQEFSQLIGPDAVLQVQREQLNAHHLWQLGHFCLGAL